jgi:hypothetical protein
MKDVVKDVEMRSYVGRATDRADLASLARHRPAGQKVTRHQLSLTDQHSPISRTQHSFAPIASL